MGGVKFVIKRLSDGTYLTMSNGFQQDLQIARVYHTRGPATIEVRGRTYQGNPDRLVVIRVSLVEDKG